MLATTITLADKYNYLDEKFQKAFHWLRTTDLAALELGVHTIHGEEVFAQVQQYTTVAAESAYFETHDTFFDLQYVISGSEQFGVCRREGLKVREVKAENDLVFYEEPQACGSVLLLPGDFIIVAPEDAHKPRCIAGTACEVKKIVIKIRV